MLLRSDSLWGSLCWGIRLVHSEERLLEILAAYQQSEEKEDAFYISSAFSWKLVDGKKMPYFPSPYKVINPGAIEGVNLWDRKITYRKRKQPRKQTALPLPVFLENISPSYSSTTLLQDTITTVPKIESLSIQQNKIDRALGGTLEIEEQGQLFRTEQNFMNSKGGMAGLFFLVKGNTKVIESALRLLRHLGIGGDRNIGKGTFDMTIEDFEIHEPSDYNAMVNLSLYTPANEEELKYFINHDNSNLFRFQREERIGRVGFLAQSKYKKKPVNCFKEGSIFPVHAKDWKRVWGKNQIVMSPPLSPHDIHYYGHGLMLKAKILI